MELNKEIINIPDFITEINNMDCFDRLLIWNHKNVHILHCELKSKLTNEKKYFTKNEMVDWKTFQDVNYTVIDNGKDWNKSGNAQRYKVIEKEIHRWYWLFKKEIFKK